MLVPDRNLHECEVLPPKLSVSILFSICSYGTSTSVYVEMISLHPGGLFTCIEYFHHH